ncbi:MULTISPECIES: iron uptake transporter deferrochelatase/peroxidase subunit [unclassified Arthrobacter]|uniref:iron uptake transporter deferrochelatase/peroxidase subunit n=1 Tax=Arthrobacter sp. Leaf234 TaxID=1736303 RepID=UPI0006F1C435|nr:iron uptake transporter deferrochelatase/peroxidase subunit [Arthrobacter sp. Leaf234]KQO03176.1 peroxidase [Arthrobacter sp. Leaf234]
MARTFRISRRRALSLAGVTAAAGVGAGVAAGRATPEATASPPDPDVLSYPFHGEHQAGITTPAQDRLHFAAFDVDDISREELIGLLEDWTSAAARMSQGGSAGDFAPDAGPYEAPPEDTGEAMDLGPTGLTITFGFGPTLFTTADGTDRFGIADRRPRVLTELPTFAGDMLQERISGGDLCIQACADDPQVAVHAVRNLSRIAFGRASLRYSQLGFGRTSSTSTAQVTPRNLFGFKDGTANVKAEDPAAVDEHVWVAEGDDQAWMAGGSYLVSRKVRMNVEPWDRTRLSEQERSIGRTKGSGAPLSGGDEFTAPDFTMPGSGGQPIIAEHSHVRLAHPDSNGGARMLRRGYNYVDGNDDLGRLDAGLFFICFQRDPERSFIPVQTSLAGSDILNEYIRHIGSGIFAVPGGAAEGSYVGARLFEA